MEAWGSLTAESIESLNHVQIPVNNVSILPYTLKKAWFNLSPHTMSRIQIRGTINTEKNISNLSSDSNWDCLCSLSENIFGKGVTPLFPAFNLSAICRRVVVTTENGIKNPSSNPGWNCLEKGMFSPFSSFYIQPG